MITVMQLISQQAAPRLGRESNRFSDHPCRLLIQILPGLLLILLMSLIQTGCSPSPDECYDLAVASEKAAKQAWEAKNHKAARKAFETANRAATRFEKALKNAPKDAGEERNHQRLIQVQTATRNARKYAETAEEEHERQKRLTGLKVTTYKKARSIVFEALIPQMAGAARRASENDWNQLSAPDQRLAELAWFCANELEDCTPPKQDRAQWNKAADTMQAWATNPPVECRLIIAMGFASAKLDDFALFELETINPATIEKKELRLIHQMGKGVFYSLQGWNRLAAVEFEAVAHAVGEDGEAIDGNMIAALVHGVAAYNAMTKNDLLTMDAEIAESIRAWPNNPISIFLTGERLAASGEWEKAAESLEAAVAGTKGEWLAERLSTRAKALRDGKGSAKSFVLDAPLVIEFGFRMLLEKMGETPAGKRFSSTMTKIQKAGSQFRQAIQLSGSAHADNQNSDRGTPGNQLSTTNKTK